MSGQDLRARFPDAHDTYISFAEKFFRENKLGTFSEPQFWSLIDGARSALSSSNSEDENDRIHREALAKSLSTLDNAQLYDAAEIYQKRFFDLYNRKVWSAICIVWGGCSDDSFMDFREWVLSQGEDAFKAIRDDPDTLPELMLKAGTGCPFFEGAIGGPIWQIFEDRTGGYDIPLLDQTFPELTGEWIAETEAARRLPNCFEHRKS